ncbi:hypothetical protein SADUNF_Sadunf08G0125400 [Salix dunnii]|uniref:Uncharacterized protein n=1 Tax=Salix dunnii TaxID=1413687 RepID=A0A835K2T6_9ROSI|nr:hypothetical protein SADUNF_Sadunf08G0125400 [Salix dunnii]
MHAQFFSSYFPPPETLSLLFYPPRRPLHLHRPLAYEKIRFKMACLGLTASSRASGLVEGKEIRGVTAKLCFDKDPFVQIYLKFNSSSGLYDDVLQLFEEMRNFQFEARRRGSVNHNTGFWPSLKFKARDILYLKTPATAENSMKLSDVKLLSYSRIQIHMQQDSGFTSVTLPDNTVNGREENSNPLRFAKASPICSPLPLLTLYKTHREFKSSPSRINVNLAVDLSVGDSVLGQYLGVEIAELSKESGVHSTLAREEESLDSDVVVLYAFMAELIVSACLVKKRILSKDLMAHKDMARLLTPSARFHLLPVLGEPPHAIQVN